MRAFQNLFHCDTYGGNRGYEERFQWFVVSRNQQLAPYIVQRTQFEKTIGLATNNSSNQTVINSLARLLGISLERSSYDLFVEEIGLPTIIAIFYDVSVPDSGGSTDFDMTKDFHYRKYCLFKFASFLDLLRPGVVHWRGQAELETVPFLCAGLDGFQAAGLQGRTSMLSRWVKQPGPSAFSEKSSVRSRRVMERRAFLLKLENMKPQEVARRLDQAGFKPRSHPSYISFFTANRRSFETWLSTERKASRNSWRP
jgi:hypothetical protein